MFTEKIFLHFFDLHFLAERAIENLFVRVKGEMRLATRLAVLSAKQVLIPAASFYESPACNDILQEYLPVADLGIFALVGQAGNLSDFCEGKVYQYDEQSKQRTAYEAALRDALIIPFKRRFRSATKDIAKDWLTLLDHSEVPGLLEGCRLNVPSDIETRWQLVPARLDGRAFIVEYVVPLLFDGKVNRAVTNKLHNVINRAYFGSYLVEMQATVMGDLILLDSPHFDSSNLDVIPYRFIVQELNKRNKLEWLVNCSVEELFVFRETAEWNDVFFSAYARKQKQGSIRDQMQRYMLGKIPLATDAADLKVKKNGDTYVHQEIIMGDKYTAGQVGAQGPGAIAAHMTFTHIGDSDQRSINLEALAGELGTLRQHLKSIATTAAHDVAVGCVAAAEGEAKRGNREAALASLAKAGQWALDVAQTIGLGVVANVLSKLIGL